MRGSTRLSLLVVAWLAFYLSPVRGAGAQRAAPSRGPYARRLHGSHGYGDTPAGYNSLQLRHRDRLSSSDYYLAQRRSVPPWSFGQ